MWRIHQAILDLNTSIEVVSSRLNRHGGALLLVDVDRSQTVPAFVAAGRGNPAAIEDASVQHVVTSTSMSHMSSEDMFDLFLNSPVVVTDTDRLRRLLSGRPLASPVSPLPLQGAVHFPASGQQSSRHNGAVSAVGDDSTVHFSSPAPPKSQSKVTSASAGV